MKLRQKLDELAAKTKICTAADAAAAKQSYQAAIRQLGNMGVAAKEMRRANDGDLRKLLEEISRRTAAFKPETLVSEAAAECDKARTAASAAAEAATAGHGSHVAGQSGRPPPGPTARMRGTLWPRGRRTPAPAWCSAASSTNWAGCRPLPRH